MHASRLQKSSLKEKDWIIKTIIPLNSDILMEEEWLFYRCAIMTYESHFQQDSHFLQDLAKNVIRCREGVP